MFNDLLVVFIQLVTNYVSDVLWRGDSTVEFTSTIQAAAATGAADAAGKADAATGDLEASMTAPI